MNKRIKELEPQCWEHNEFGLNFNYEKFAKLIVRECLEQVFYTIEDEEQDNISSSIRDKIKQHFGVEE